MARARALLFPGEEDFGIVPVEAQAAGLPVIAYGVGGSRDTVVDGRTGVLYDEAGGRRAVRRDRALRGVALRGRRPARARVALRAGAVPARVRRRPAAGGRMNEQQAPGGRPGAARPARALVGRRPVGARVHGRRARVLALLREGVHGDLQAALPRVQPARAGRRLLRPDRRRPRGHEGDERPARHDARGGRRRAPRHRREALHRRPARQGVRRDGGEREHRRRQRHGHRSGAGGEARELVGAGVQELQPAHRAREGPGG